MHALAFPSAEETAPYRWAEAALLVALVAACAASVDDLGLVFQLVGSTCGALLMFVLPAALRLFGRQRPAASSLDLAGLAAKDGGNFGGGRANAGAADVVLAWASLAFGLVVLGGSTAVTLSGRSVQRPLMRFYAESHGPRMACRMRDP